MNKNNIVKNVKYKLVKSINPKYVEVTVIFTRNGQIDRKFIFLDKVKGYKDKDYLKLAKKKFNEKDTDNKVTKIEKHKLPTAKVSPLLVTFTCILGVTSLSLTGLFTYQMLGGKFPRPSNERTLTLNLENCTINGQSTYQKTYTKGDTIDKVTVTPSDDDHLLSKNSVNSEYQKYWKDSTGDNFTFSDLVMDKDYTIDIKAVNAYTLNISLFGCQIEGETEHYVSRKYAEGETIEDIIVEPADGGAELDNDSIDPDYKQYWSREGAANYKLSGIKMTRNHSIFIREKSRRVLILNLTDCNVDDNSSHTHRKSYVEGAPIDPITVVPDSGYELTEDSVPSEYQGYWAPETGDTGNYILSNIVMSDDVTIAINAQKDFTIALTLNNCNVDGSSTYTKSYIEGKTIDDIVVSPNTGYVLTEESVPAAYRDRWDESEEQEGDYVLSGIVMNDNITIEVNAIESYTLTITLSDCTIDGSSEDYEKIYPKGQKIDDVIVSPIDGYKLDNTSISPVTYSDNWIDNGDGSYKLTGIVMNSDCDIAISAIYNKCTITLTLNNCNVDGSSTYTKSYIEGKTIEDIVVSPDSGYVLTEDSVPSEYQGYWAPETGDTGNYILSGIEMNDDITIAVNAGVAIIPPTGITITPNVVIPGEDYVGEIEVADPETGTKHVLPEDISLTSETNEDILFIYKLQLGRKSAILEIPDEYTHSEITVTCNTINENDMWFNKDDWWNFCSNGEPNQQAISTDIGQEVKAVVNGEPQPILLIDIDKDIERVSSDFAHCTFEFKDPIKDTSGGYFQPILFNWNIEDGDDSTNFDFINSTLNKKLLTDIGEIYKMLPDDLTEKIVDVSKAVEISNDEGETYVKDSYYTKLFPLSYDEMYGDEKVNRYKYYEDDDATRPVNSWLRSPFTDKTDPYYQRMAWYTSGKVPSHEGFVYRNRSGIAPGFCI